MKRSSIIITAVQLYICFMTILSKTVEIEKDNKNQLLLSKDRLDASSILVTGAAGFIGSHLVGHLINIGFKTVVGIDTFNAYYSPALKRERVTNLFNKYGATVLDGDVCDAEMLSNLFTKHQFTHVIHLAAQAGVRYSLIQPLTYIHTNLKCFTVLLEQIRSVGDNYGKDKMPHFLYASSSSVYGLNEKIPFSESDPVDKPSNLYGATKRSNELMAYSYFHLFGIQSVGFRFFTVYGPWGRPDMAAYIFTEQISRGDTITVYNNGNMKRDFTYVDDIVSGITASLDYKHTKPIVFNLGNNKPVEALRFLQLIEKSLGIKAKVRFEDSLAEIPVTYANTTLAYQELGFVAKTSIEEGIEKFIAWYKEHESKTILCETGCYVGNMCTKSQWERPMVDSRKLTQGCRIVVYTTAAHENLLNPLPSFNDITENCFIAYINDSGKRSISQQQQQQQQEMKMSVVDHWTYIYVDMEKEEKDIKGFLRAVKLSPKLFFADSVQYGIYVDHKIKLVMKPSDLVHLMENSHVPIDKTTGAADATAATTTTTTTSTSTSTSSSSSMNLIMVVQTPRFNDLKEEARTQAAVNQIKAYEDYQERLKIKNIHLLDSSLIVHNLADSDAQIIRCKWYREAQEWSDRENTSGAFTFAVANVGTKAVVTHTTATGTWIPVVKTKGERNASSSSSSSSVSTTGGMLKYVYILPAKKYHWHFVSDLASNH